MPPGLLVRFLLVMATQAELRSPFVHTLAVPADLGYGTEGLGDSGAKALVATIGISAQKYR